MATGAEIARTRYAEVQGITRSVVEAVQALWRDVSPDRILIAMQGETGRQILEAVIAGQLSAAQGAQAFVSACLLADGAGFSPRGNLIPSRLAGIAMDGRPLASLLFMPAVTTARALALGMSPERAALLGLNQMAMLASTVVADTARAATSVAMAAERTTVRYVRVVSAPACGRCIVLAGREYSYSTGFRRHPRCDCGMRPVRSDAEWRGMQGPEDLVRQMTPEEKNRAFGAAGARALERGADIGQVVNARRGMSTAAPGGRQNATTTNEGTTRRGWAARAMQQEHNRREDSRYWRTHEPRLMPEEIFRQAKGDREKELALMRRHGYLS